ncbi:tail fiber protein [Ferrimonas sp. YFM]|uniref:phage tail protein n=1 Tax=Ferrimonas sp. YFM TaxID=3028878 RepID=UPI002574774A|nr:tail fiber protein [Ferrimonas sp. YFM]BDY06000.1 tail Collar domain-containing protein [Ferrimonas sp. YFM]
MSDPFMGEITQMPYTFAPKDYAFCQGQFLTVSDNQALFSLLGDTFGGNGRTNFALPDLRSRVPVGMGTYQGYEGFVHDYRWGERGGVEKVNLSQSQLGQHTHALKCAAVDGDTHVPRDNSALAQTPVLPAQGFIAADAFAPYSGTHLVLAPQSSSSVGGGLSHVNVQPYLAIQFAIALDGIYPPRN